MQKKSLLVALFCGALCLTGCIKNEESASVAQVRIAKANELNSIATLNEAKAQAEVIYANAEATIAKAEAALKEAEAALVLAKAETEKVRAQLLKTQVALQEVKVEEEKVELEKKLAELEVTLAEAEAAKAKAEAAKQAWVNALNNLLAKAEVDAIKNAQALLAAQEDLEAYVLTMEGQKADSAKAYAELYFASLKEVEKLQMQELEVKAAKVLVNQGAILARDYIHEMIEANEDTIAMNNEIIEALKESQTMTPEEAEEALIEARKNLNAAYTAYREAKEAENVLEEAFEEEWDKTSDFQKFFRNTPLTQGIAMMMPNGRGVRPGRTDAEPTAEPIAIAVRRARGFEFDHKSIVTVDGVDVEVPTAGLNVRTEEGWDFIPFWNAEVTDTVHTRYPDVDVYKKNHSDHLHISDVVIAPATIYYDNIKAALDTVVARAEAEAERNIARAERRMNRQIARLEEQIEAYEDSIELHQQYVDARRDTVEKYEEAYIMALAAAKDSEDAIEAAWEAFQEHMLLEHPTVSRSLFIAHYWADTAHRKAVADTLDALDELEGVQEGLDDNKAAVKAAFEAYAKAKGVYKKAYDSLHYTGPKATEAQKAAAAYDKACAAWNPDFANAATEDNVEIYSQGTETDITGYYNYKWYINVDGGDDIFAGTYQDSTLTASYNLKLAKQKAYHAQIDVWANVPGAAAQKTAADAAVSEWTKRVPIAQAKQDAAWLTFTEAYAAYYDAVGVFPEHLTDAYNPAVEIFDIADFPTDAYDATGIKYYVDTTTTGASHAIKYYDKKTGKWSENGKPAGTAQAAVLDAVLVVMCQEGAIKVATEEFTDALEAEFLAKDRLTTADKNLIAAIKGVDPSKVDMKKEKIEDYLDEDDMPLYEAYLESYKDVKTADKAWAALKKAYAPYPDEVGAVRPYDYPRARFNNFGWLVSNYNVDYEATYIGKDGKEHSIARFLNGRRHRNPYARSLQYRAEQAQKQIDVTLPEELAEYTKTQNKNVSDLQKDVDAVMAKVNAYKTYEAGYQNWVEERDAVEELYIAAQIATYDAKAEYKTAQAINDAVEAVINEGVYVYDPKMEIYNKFKEAGATHDWRGFTLLPVANAIEVLEDENEELEAENEFLRNVLHDGKNVLSVVNEILDQKIAVISDNIQILVAISAEYKAIMNGYLGIVDEDVTEEPAVEGEEE